MHIRPSNVDIASKAYRIKTRRAVNRQREARRQAELRRMLTSCRTIVHNFGKSSPRPARFL